MYSSTDSMFESGHQSENVILLSLCEVRWLQANNLDKNIQAVAILDS